MKKKKLNLDKWTMHYPDGTVTKITKDNFHELSKEMQAVIHFRQKKGRGFFLQPKYYQSLHEAHKKQLTELYDCNPEMPINKVVAKQLSEIPDYIPLEKVREFTDFVFKTWEELAVNEPVSI